MKAAEGGGTAVQAEELERREQRSGRVEGDQEPSGAISPQPIEAIDREDHGEVDERRREDTLGEQIRNRQQRETRLVQEDRRGGEEAPDQREQAEGPRLAMLGAQETDDRA